MEEEVTKAALLMLPNGEVEVDKDSLSVLCSLETEQYDENKTFSQELKTQDRVLWVFEYSEEVNRKTRERYENLEKNTNLDTVSEITSPQETTISDGDNDDPSPSQILQNYKTPHSNKRTTKRVAGRQESSEVLDSTSAPVRNTPLPLMSWADSTEVWQNMIYKEEATSKMRNSKLFQELNTYLPRMRAILLDWIMEVCEVYRLRRVTYYLSIDYIDRYLTIKPTIPKTQLQLLGVSCLFIAAKLEEIYPPKLSEFSYVCDGACTETEILACEVLLLNTLGWDVNPMTPSGWLNLYMQLYYNADNLRKQKMHEDSTCNFQFPQYSAFQFMRASHIIDLFSMDPGFLKYSYSVIAAGAMYYIFGKQVAVNVSGLSWNLLEACVKYMSVFNKVIDDSTDPRLQCVTSQDVDARQNAAFKALKKNIPFLVADENHCLQTHVVDLDFFERATVMRLKEMGCCTEKSTETEKNSGDTTDEEQPKEDVLKSEDTATVVMSELEKILDEHLNCEIPYKANGSDENSDKEL